VQGMYITIAGYYLNSFFLETACIDPVLVGVMQATSGLFDAINDPIIGGLSDRTRTRWGRRRPWLLFGAPVLAAAYFGLWNALPPSAPQGVKFAYSLAMYSGVSMGVTSIQVQVGALVPELTDDYDERTIVSAWRVGMMAVLGLCAAVVHNFIVSSQPVGREARGYRVSGAVVAIVMLLTAWTTFLGIKEKFQPKQESKESIGCLRGLQTLLRNRAYVCVTGAYLCGPTAVVLVQSNLFMMCKYVIGDASVINKCIPCVQIAGLLCLPLWVLLGKKLDKRAVYMVSGSILMVAMGCVFFITTETEAIVLSCMAGASLSTPYMIPYSMLPDVIDEDELRTGKRREGLFVGFFTIMLKLSVTISLTLANVMLKTFGYVAPVASCGASAQETDEAGEQTEMALLCIRLLCSFVPASFVLFAMILVWAFPITRQRQRAMATIAAEARKHRCALSDEGMDATVSIDSPRSMPALAAFLSEAVVDETDVVSEMIRSFAAPITEEDPREEFEAIPDATKHVSPATTSRSEDACPAHESFDTQRDVLVVASEVPEAEV